MTNRSITTKTLALILTVVLILGGVVGGTVAWLIANPDPVVNTFTYGDINIDLEETDTNLDEDDDPNTNEYEMMPGQEIVKDPKITVKAGMEPVALEVMDNTPNGSEERPFVINEDSLTVTVPAGETYHFTLFGGYNRTLHVTDAGAEILFRDQTYAPDENGSIAVRIVTDSPRDHAYVALTNKNGDTREITLTLVSDPGAMDNPIVIETLGEAITANVPQDGMVYYRWTATAAGKLTVTSADAINNISLNNLANSKVTDLTNGAESVTLEVAEGDTITIVVSVIGGDKQAETNPVTFTLTLGE